MEDEIGIEKEKARTAMELARIEIKAAEERFKKMISEKEDEVRKSRKIAQQNEDVQVCTKLIN